MKIPITDQFLWDVYNFLQKHHVKDFIFGSYIRQSSILTGQLNPIIENYKNKKNAKKFDKMIYYLKKKNLIKVKNLEHKKAIILTNQGISKALKVNFSIDKRIKRKDGKWIMLMFDIPITNRRARSLLKSILLNLGYKMFQQSVWVTPYDVSEKTEKLLQLYSLDWYVKIFIVEEV